MAVEIGVAPITRAQLISVARSFETVSSVTRPLLLEDQRAPLTHSSRAEPRSTDSRLVRFARDDVHFAQERRDLQRSLIRSHAAGVGAEVETRSCARYGLAPHQPLQWRLGRSPSTAEAYAALLNAGITPIVHESARSDARATSPAGARGPRVNG